MLLYVLFEHACGYGLFRVKEFEEIGALLPQVEAASQDASKFQQVVSLVGFKAHGNAASALKNINAISEGLMTEELQSFLEINMPKNEKKNEVQLGVSEPKLGAAINEALSIKVMHSGVVPEIVRGIRFHIRHYIKGLTVASLKQTELGLGHSYSRSKVKFNVNKSDNMIIQSIALIDQMDKDINTFAMRIREWYSYHFPELIKVVPDNFLFAKCVHFIKNRTSINEDSLEALEAIVMDSAKAQAILDAARMSMGMDISEIDLMNIEKFAKRLISLAEYRVGLSEYLRSKMGAVAPNLSVLIGEVVGARLISHAGSLTNLAKYPASTVQILGAEKALFRALKSKGNTPKYGLIFHSTFIGRAAASNKGRISRYLANKCSIASRIDCFAEHATTVFGHKLKNQVEDRLSFYETGAIPRKNDEVMKEAVEENNVEVARLVKKDKKKKRKLSEVEDNGVAVTESTETEETPKKKKKKKKAQSESEANDTMESVENGTPVEKKKKKKGNADNSLNISVISNGTADEETPKKKKKKSTTEEQENNESIVENTENSSKKKKKKKKQLDDTVESMNNTITEENDSTPIKKKKKKHVDQ